jgi:hypothetical protein
MFENDVSMIDESNDFSELTACSLMVHERRDSTNQDDLLKKR